MTRGIDQPQQRQPETPVDIVARLEQAYTELAESEERLANAGAGMEYTLAFENRRLKRALLETWERKGEELVVEVLAVSGLLRANNRTLNEDNS